MHSLRNDVPTGFHLGCSQVDILNRAHSLVLEETWSATRNVAHGFRVHLLNHKLGTLPRNSGLAIRWPSVTQGVTNPDAWVVPVTRVTVSNALYLHTPRSDFKVGGEMALGMHDQDSHVYGFFVFQTTRRSIPRIQTHGRRNSIS